MAKAGLVASLFLLPAAAVAFAAGRMTAPAPAPEVVVAPPDDGAMQPRPAPARKDPPAPPPAVPSPAAMQRSVAPLVESVKHAVVSINTTKIIRRVVEDPFTEYLRERFGVGSSPRTQTRTGLGSGFIIDRDGTVLTNNHVVAGADIVEVTLDDGRKLKAEVVGSDPATDVAVVKIENPPGDLHAATLGNSDEVRVGDYVLAIGNPLGLGKTVTMGIVSAKNRSLGQDLGDVPVRYQDFIQTDAAINQGNSGGPLFNFAGEVIGVNSAILNPAVAMNVGFAIPMNLARQVAAQLQKSGRVSRGFLGVRTDDLTADKARRYGVAETAGALVLSVVQGSPAEKAGLRRGDVLTEVAGRTLNRENALAQTVANLPPGTRVDIVFTREGKRFETAAVLEEQAKGVALQALAIVVTPLEAEDARQAGVRPGQGLRVVFVNPRGPTSGTLRDGDVIVAINDNAATVDVLKSFERELLRGGYGRLVLVRDGRRMQVTLSG